MRDTRINSSDIQAKPAEVIPSTNEAKILEKVDLVCQPSSVSFNASDYVNILKAWLTSATLQKLGLEESSFSAKWIAISIIAMVLLLVLSQILF